MVDAKTFTKKSINLILVPSQRNKDSRHILQNHKVPSKVMGFSNRAQRFTESNYLDIDSPLSVHFNYNHLYRNMHCKSLSSRHSRECVTLLKMRRKLKTNFSFLGPISLSNFSFVYSNILIS